MKCSAVICLPQQICPAPLFHFILFSSTDTSIKYPSLSSSTCSSTEASVVLEKPMYYHFLGIQILRLTSHIGELLVKAKAENNKEVKINFEEYRSY